MSETVKKKTNEKKLSKGNLKSNNNTNNINSNIDSKTNQNISKKDLVSLPQKNKKIVQINLQNNSRKSPEKNKAKKKGEGGIAFNHVFRQGKFLNDSKILKNFLSFFNIRELFIIMEIDYHIYQAIIDSDVFKKYLSIRKDFIVKKNQKNQVTKNIKNVVKEDNDDISPVSLGFNDALSTYQNKSGKMDKKSVREDKKNIKDINKDALKRKIELKLPKIDFHKLKINYLIHNNCQVIKKYIKSLSLNNHEANVIFVGIIEYLIIKENGIPFDKNEPKIFSLRNSQALTGLSYFIESLMNLYYPNIIKLDISNVGISSIDIMKKLCLIFHKYSSSLKILNLSNNSLDDKCAKLLFSGLQNNKSLEILNLSHNEIGEEGLLLGEKFFCSNHTLHTLNFQHNLLGPNGITYLFNFFLLNKYMNLKSLEIGYNGITKEGAKSISKYIKYNEHLITLNIEGNYLCNEGINSICDSISLKERNLLSFLNLENNNITKKGSQYISKILIESPFINCLSLKNNSLDNDGVNKIISLINLENSNLISLNLSNTKIDEKALKIIAEKINTDFSIQKLILSNNNFKNGGNYIKNLLIKESNLKYLDLSFCSISSQFNLIFEGLIKNQNLKTLNFSGNNIPMKQEILNELGKVLANNNKIRNLFLNECNIDDIGMNFINSNLEKNHSLIALCLNHNFISKKSIPGLENAIQKNKVIKNITLYENVELDIKDINQIETLLKNNEKNTLIVNEENNINQ